MLCLHTKSTLYASLNMDKFTEEDGVVVTEDTLTSEVGLTSCWCSSFALI